MFNKTINRLAVIAGAGVAAVFKSVLPNIVRKRRVLKKLGARIQKASKVIRRLRGKRGTRKGPLRGSDGKFMKS